MFVKTVSTTSGINPIKFDETSGVFYWILNTGSSTVYASTEDVFSAGDDGVVSLGPKESRRLETQNDTIYILGEGQVEIHNQRDGICSFKQAPTSSGGGETIDAYTKTESDAKYAEKSDVIPYKMGMDFGTCATAAETINKTVTTLNKSEPGVGAIFAIKFSNAVPDQSRLTVNGMSGYIQYRGSSIPAGIINAGDVATFMHYINSGFHVFEILSVESDNTYTKEESDNLYASKEIYGDNGIELQSTDGMNTITHGEDCTSSGRNSYAGGYSCTSSGKNSYAGGHRCLSYGENSYAGGYRCTSYAENSYAGGYSCVAKGAESFAQGDHITVDNKCEVAFGGYNVSNNDTLFSIGDGTSVSARHNAFEITKTGGKLHDRDIGISLTNAESAATRIEIPDNVNVSTWLRENAKSGKQYFISTKGSRTGLPNVSADWMWFSYDTNRYLARTWTGDTHTSDFILDVVNSVGGWKEISYTPIKSTTFSGTTNTYGDLVWTSAMVGKVPLFVDVESKYGIPFRSVNNYWIHMTHATVNNYSQPAANVAVSGTVYYVEI